MTERLSDDRRHALNQGMIIREEENAEDVFDLLDSELRTPCSFSITSDWGEVEILTPGAYFMIGSKTQVPPKMTVDNKKIHFGITPVGTPYPTIAIE